ncbi:MAG: amidohydrolase [Oscillospiraceae bacterium]|nr:amidohydrolase [Oscillospiraceae bacterium]
MTHPALGAIDRAAEKLCKMSDAVWETPETAFSEHKSVETLIAGLKDLGFEVTEKLAGIDTAFCGRYGSGKPVIGFLGEFDALSGLSQISGIAEKKPLVEGGAGHGCGHNLLGVGAIGAAVALKEYIETTGCSGTVVFYGCPGEEGGSGKAFMARDGVFDELDCAITWHPWDANRASNETSLANYQVAYKFKGISSHAASSPHLGRSALDAVELMNVGVQFLREHVVDSVRIHYAITDAGGYSPNVVQPKAEVLYLIRAKDNVQLAELYKRVNKIAQGAALMTETELEIDFIKACSNMVCNTTLLKLLQESLETVERPQYTEEDIRYAKEIQATLGDIPNRYAVELNRHDDEGKKFLKEHFDGRPIFDFVFPYAHVEGDLGGSTDVGDVSWICPTAQILAVTEAALTPGHSWQETAQGKSPIAHKGMIYAAKAMADTAIKLFEKPELIEQAKKEHAERLDGAKYECAIPKEVRPRAIAPKK